MAFSGLGAKRVSSYAILRTLVLAAIAAFVIQTAGKAMVAAFVNDQFPEGLAVKLELMPVLFPVHMVSGGAALILVPLALMMRPWRRWHRLAGRIAAIDVLVAGVTAFPVALVAPVTAWSAAGFCAQAAIWLVLLGSGVWHIRHRRIHQHRACMLMMLATMTGAIFFRIYLALWAIFAHGRHFELFYAGNAWIAWLLPLVLTALALKQTGLNRAHPR